MSSLRIALLMLPMIAWDIPSAIAGG